MTKELDLLLEYTCDTYPKCDNRCYDCPLHKSEIIVREELKALEIIKKHKMIWFDYLLNCKSVNEYNKTILDYYDDDKETCEQFFLLSWEFDLLKEVLL